MMNAKKVFFGVLLLLVLAMMVGCRPVDKAADAGTDALESTEKAENVISDVEAGDVETHVVIDKQTFTEGENVENAYYKRTTNPDGEPSFEVVKKADGSIAYLPMNDTVIYTSDTGECFYETITLNYNLDGKPVTSTQYQLYVTSEGVEEVTAPDNGLAGEDGESGQTESGIALETSVTEITPDK